MSTEFEGRNSITPTDHLDTESGRLIPTERPGFSPSQSPSAPTPKTATHFPDIPERHWLVDCFENLLEGQKIRRLSWPDSECVFFKAVRFSAESPETADVLTIRRADGSEHNWLIARQDLENADDWVIVE